jgi:hypothetical protein
LTAVPEIFASLKQGRFLGPNSAPKLESRGSQTEKEKKTFRLGHSTSFLKISPLLTRQISGGRAWLVKLALEPTSMLELLNESNKQRKPQCGTNLYQEDLDDRAGRTLCMHVSNECAIPMRLASGPSTSNLMSKHKVKISCRLVM